MNLVLNNIETLVAYERIQDDAFDLWIHSKDENKGNVAVAAFYSRHHIKANDTYIKVSFVDTETGECLFINCLPKMHNAMLTHKIYPDFILNAFKN